jgi:serine phosphatase RsbU (regulator of sigma subunit)
VLGDISGKGVAAALVVALVMSTIEGQARLTSQPQAFLTALNTRLAEQLQACHLFTALLYLVVDLHERALYVANAGMVAPLLVRAGEATLLDVRGLPIGILRDVPYDEARVALLPGDRLVLVSDGVVEARSRMGELWGFERLQRLLAGATSASTPEALAREVLGRVEAFTDGAALHDDLTLLVLEPKTPTPGA